ncbi:F0F1 ATP synthase subunit epsilon [Candidatus Kaiserbacteria bacterium]|nr:F0F1 ATP synthase subunit epsilon [Candidatus Kaiserbacteria bacterium]
MASNDTFHLVIASVGETRFDGRALSATFPGSDGELTVLAHHEPFVTTLKKGTIRVREISPSQGGSTSGGKDFPIESGVLEISGNRAVVLL